MQHTSTNNHTIIVHMTDQEFDRLLALHKRFDSRISDNELLKRCMRIVSGMGTMEMRKV